MRSGLFSILILSTLSCSVARAVTTVFFAPSQVATPVAFGTTWDSVSCDGYVFKYTRDKLFTGGIGPDPIGRPVRVTWPTGVEAQAVTAGPSTSGARIDIRRVDNAVFDFTSFTAKLLANTAGAGASFEIMPKLNGEDAFNDPIYFFASGYYGSVFSYNETTPSYLGNTSLLKGYESYTIGLYVDFALTVSTFVDASVPPNLNGDFNLSGVVDAADYVEFRSGLDTIYTPTDYDTWRANFGATGGNGAALPALASPVSVPEPCTAVLLMMAWCGATVRLRNHHRHSHFLT
jgi:hypothetical protein